jgi:hypothetical protein
MAFSPFSVKTNGETTKYDSWQPNVPADGRPRIESWPVVLLDHSLLRAAICWILSRSDNPRDITDLDSGSAVVRNYKKSVAKYLANVFESWADSVSDDTLRADIERLADSVIRTSVKSLVSDNYPAPLVYQPGETDNVPAEPETVSKPSPAETLKRSRAAKRAKS